MSMSCPPGTVVYRIVAGDTLYTLAQRYGTTVTAILAANPGINPNALMIGQNICIPSGAQPIPCPAGSTSYTIRAGDTLYAIAQRYGATVAAILAANPGLDPNSLQIARIICIPAPPAVSSDCVVLLSLSSSAIPAIPTVAGGAALIQRVNPQFYAVTFVLRGVPDPSELGNYNAYEGVVLVGGQRFLVDLVKAQAFEQEPTWSGTRSIQANPLLSPTNALTIVPFNSQSGAEGPAIVGGTVAQCMR